jgi:hypothetical protein
VPIAPARRDLRRVPGAVAVQVLADVAGEVARVLEPDRERLGAIERGEAAGREAVAKDAGVVRVATAQEGRTGRAADRVGGEVVGEGDALVADQPLDLRQRPHRLDRLVVGHHDDHVRMAGTGLAGRRRCRRPERADERHGEGQRPPRGDHRAISLRSPISSANTTRSAK